MDNNKNLLKVEDLGATYKSEVLLDGSRLFVFERPDAPIFLRASFLSGSRYDPVGKEGVAHFLEHMLVAGTKKFATKDKLAAFIEGLGGGFGATTNAETINIDVSVGDPNDLEKVVDVMREILKESLFNPKTIETERGSIFRELGDKKSNPSIMIWEVYRKLFFQSSNIGRSTLGSEETIKGITREDLQDFYSKVLNSSQMVFVAAGGIKFEKIKQLIEKNLLTKKQLKPPTDTQSLPIVRKDKISIERYDAKNQIQLALGFRTARAFDPDEPVLNVIAEVLGRGRSSTLAKKLRYEKGLVYTINAWTGEFTDAGTWMVKTSTPKENLQQVIDIVISEIRRVVDNGLTEEEVAFAKDKILKSKRSQLQSSQEWVNFHSFKQLVSKKDWTLSDFSEEIATVTQEQTKKVAQKYFTNDNWFLALCGDVSESEININL